MKDLPSNWKQTLGRCNFYLAARQIAEFIRTAKAEAEAQRGYYAYKNEFVSGWKAFSANPCHETAVQFLEGTPEYSSLVFNFFEGSCPSGIFYRKGIQTAGNFVLGDYRLDMHFQDIKGLSELTEAEYTIFGRESLQDVIYHAHPTEFVGRNWDIMVGTIEGKIYQIAAGIEFSSEKEPPENLIRDVYQHCELLLGTPTEETQGYFIWDTNTGKVIFQFAIIVDTFAANLFIGDKGNQRYGNS